MGAIIGGGKIYAIGNGGDGIRIGKGAVYQVAETYTAHNGGSGFVQEDAPAIPVELYKIFLQEVQSCGAPDQQAVGIAAEKSGLAKWLADHGIEAAAFLMDFVEKAQSSEWLSSTFKQYLD